MLRVSERSFVISVPKEASRRVKLTPEHKCAETQPAAGGGTLREDALANRSPPSPPFVSSVKCSSARPRPYFHVVAGFGPATPIAKAWEQQKGSFGSTL